MNIYDLIRSLCPVFFTPASFFQKSTTNNEIQEQAQPILKEVTIAEKDMAATKIQRWFRHHRALEIQTLYGEISRPETPVEEEKRLRS